MSIYFNTENKHHWELMYSESIYCTTNGYENITNCYDEKFKETKSKYLLIITLKSEDYNPASFRHILSDIKQDYSA